MESKIVQSFDVARRSLNGRLIAPYQREGVMWMLLREHQLEAPRGGFLCDEMGLGKTVQLISTILGNPKNRTLVIVPKSIIFQWKEEINKFAPSLKVYIYDGSDRPENPNEILAENPNIVICPYTLMVAKGKPKGTLTPLHRIYWNRVILDEAHEIRNKKSKISISVKNLNCDIRWIVTGTPVFNSIKDFISLCEFLGISKVMVQGMTQKIRDTYVLRRTKDDLSKFNERLRLPDCEFENVEIEMSHEEKELYSFVFSECQETVRRIFKRSAMVNFRTMELLECLLRSRQVCVYPQLYFDGVAKKNEVEPEIWNGDTEKLKKLFELISEHPTEKSLVFCQFTDEMNYIQTRLTSMGKKVFRIDGSVTGINRNYEVNNFKKSLEKDAVFVIQIKAGGQGINLQEATRVYITAPSWNPATELQAIGRSHRTGQTQKVYVKKLIYTGDDDCPSIEESIMALQGHKSLVCAEVLNDKRIENQIPTKSKNPGISIRDIKKIFAV
jgi:SNF2 family DNA or RNA helicase